MSKARNTGNLNNSIQISDTGNITFVSGSTTLLAISSSGAVTTTGVISGSNALSASFAATASFVTLSQTASFVATAQTASFVANAQSASNAVSAQTASFANALTVAGTLTAQTLVVQTITSSIDYVTGSTRFGSLSSNTHVFTGSISVSGSITTGTANVARGTAFTSPFLTNGGNLATTTGSTVRLGSFSFDAGGNGVGLGIYGLRQATGSNWTTTGIKLQLDVDNSTDLGGNLFISSNGYVGIGNTNPGTTLTVQSSGANGLLLDQSSGDANGSTRFFIKNNASTFGMIVDTSGFNITSGATVGSSTGTPRMTITSSGNVGIGTTGPRATLQVSNLTSGTSVLPSAGQSGSYTSLYITNLNHNYGLLMGALNNGNGWIQAQRTDGNTTLYDLQLQPNGGNVVIGGGATISGNTTTTGLYGKSYSQTSTSSTTSIIDTGIYFSTFGQGGVWILSYGGNPNTAGSAAYLATYYGAIHIITGFIGGTIKHLISYNAISQADASGIGALSCAVTFWNGTTETTSINNADTTYQIRIKITGYNASFVGAYQYVYLTRIGT